jgi:hypothetical protein
MGVFPFVMWVVGVGCRLDDLLERKFRPSCGVAHVLDRGGLV